MDIVESCAVCPARECIFGHLREDALAELGTIRQQHVVASGAALFTEGQAPRGLFALCSGRVKLTVTSRGGRSLIVRLAGPGEVLGLSAVVTNAPYEVTARTLDLTQFSFIPREPFLRFLQARVDVSLRVAEHLSVALRHAYQHVSRLGLAPTARAKLAGLFLDWLGPETSSASRPDRFPLPLTHHEIGELVGCSRETISRLMADFRREEMIHVRGRWVTIPDRRKLETLASEGPADSSAGDRAASRSAERKRPRLLALRPATRAASG